MTNGGATIELAGRADVRAATVVVSDVQGRALRTAYVNGKGSIDLRAMGNGAYFVSVKNGRADVTRKFIVQR